MLVKVIISFLFDYGEWLGATPYSRTNELPDKQAQYRKILRCGLYYGEVF